MVAPQKQRKRDTRPQVTYKGVEKETQTAVRKAAKKAKATIGAWVNRTLLEAAQAELGKAPPLPPMDISKEIQDQRELLETIAQEVHAMKNKPTVLQRLGFKSTPNK